MGTTCYFLLLLCSGPLLSASLSCLPCDLSKCGAPSDCSSGTVPDACGCCQVCAKVKGEGERCGGPGNIAGSCSPELVCVTSGRNGAFGTCRAVCLSYGCNIDKNECLCEYSDTCPTKQFQYTSRDECDAKLSAAQCAKVICPTPDCPPGMSYESHPLAPGDCCPAGGECVCNFSSCATDNICPDGTSLTLVKPRNSSEMDCCDIFECQTPRVIENTCRNGTEIFQQGVVWQSGCSTCTCLEKDRIVCALRQCPSLDCSETTTTADECCPVCSSDGVILNTTTSAAVGCMSSSGQVYQDGTSWSEGDCTSCLCNSGKVLCSQPGCYLGNCTAFVTRPNACCPECVDMMPTATVTNGSTASLSPTAAVDEPSSPKNITHLEHTPVGNTPVDDTFATPSWNSSDKVKLFSNSTQDTKSSDDERSNSASSHTFLLPVGLSVILIAVILVVGSVASIVTVRRLCFLRHKKLVETIDIAV